jgi:hypothetical protein
VEGYTCFLWVILLGAIKRAIPQVDLVLLARYLGVILGCLAILVVYRFSVYLHERQPGGGSKANYHIPLSMLIMATHFPLVFWCFSGMETGLYVLTLVLATFYFSKYLLEDQRPLSSLLYASLFLVLACMTRPETYVIPLCNLVFILIVERSRWAKPTVIFLLPFIVIFLPYFIWRYQYFGRLFPNTYYAKVGGGSWSLALLGLEYLKDGAIPHGIILTLIVSKFARKRDSLRITDYYFISLLAIWVATIIYTGADHFIELRFFVYMLPLMYLLIFDEIGILAERAAAWIARGFEGSRPRLIGHAYVLLIALITFLALFFYNSVGVASTTRFGRHLADSWALLGKWLDRNSEPGDVIATPVVGAIGFFCDRVVLDMLGIVDPVIAHGSETRPGHGPKDHDRFDSEYVLSRRPKYIYVMSFASNEKAFLDEKSWIPAVEDLKRLFPNRDYQYGVVTIGPHRYALYRRTDTQ